ncbi:M14 family metallopeptidase [Bacillus infantis]|uniref:M14 family metallopeptidase n=1 Tax=Bacillus infantis TaxID=324767 RepID=UPI003CEA5233
MKRWTAWICGLVLLLAMGSGPAKAEETTEYIILTADAQFHYYDEGTGEEALAEAAEGQAFPLLSVEGDKVFVDWDGLRGYILKEFTNLAEEEPGQESPDEGSVETPALPEEDGAEENVPAVPSSGVAVTDAPVFLEENGKYVKRARILKGQVFSIKGEEGNYYTIQFGYFTGYILKTDTKNANGARLPGGTETGTKPNRTRIITVNTSELLYSSNHKLAVYGRIEAGIKLPIVAEHRSYYVVEAAGRRAYIKKADVSLYTGNYVDPHVQNYTYETMLHDFKELTTWYPDYTNLVEIGRSVDGRRIYALKLGKGKEEVFVNGSHHAREHMTTNLLMEMIDQYAYAYQQNQSIEGYNVRSTLDKTSLWFVPMVNPDGVTLVQKGYKSAKNPSYVLKLNKNSKDFKAWKANIRGVDLNRQYPADWANICCDPGKPGPQNYKGKKPLSEPEAKALYDFTLAHDFKAAAAYHSSGEILYWHFHQGYSAYKRDAALAKKISSKTGYSLVPAMRNPSGGGYTDWFIQSQKKPGFTPEISPYVGNKPVPLKNFSQIWKQNRTIPLLLADEPI